MDTNATEHGCEAFGRLRSPSGTGPTGGSRFAYTRREPLGDTLGMA